MIASSTNYVEVRSYAELQRQIREALRKEHPEWIQPNGESPMCESYESRFAELLELFESRERKSIASSERVNARQEQGENHDYFNIVHSHARILSPLRRRTGRSERNIFDRRHSRLPTRVWRNATDQRRRLGRAGRSFRGDCSAAPRGGIGNRSHRHRRLLWPRSERASHRRSSSSISRRSLDRDQSRLSAAGPKPMGRGWSPRAFAISRRGQTAAIASRANRCVTTAPDRSEGSNGRSNRRIGRSSACGQDS